MVFCQLRMNGFWIVKNLRKSYTFINMGRMTQYLFFETNSSGQTKKIAGFLAKEILAGRTVPRAKNALVFALSGDLGSGKTAFVQGFLRGLGVHRKITSPTFVIAKSYKLKAKSYKLGYHIDCYRINSDAQKGRSPNLAERRGSSKELSGLGLKEVLNNPENIVLIEWPERIFVSNGKKFLPKQGLALPKNLIRIKFEHGKKINKRILKFQ